MASSSGLCAPRVELALGAGRAEDHDLGRLVEILVDAEVHPPPLLVGRMPGGAALGAALDEGDVVSPHRRALATSSHANGEHDERDHADEDDQRNQPRHTDFWHQGRPPGWTAPVYGAAEMT